jgi:MoaA/NifB/PqqE/SkfB family radical SAM enzyme
METPPIDLNLSFDNTCNLQCIMCPQRHSPQSADYLQQQEKVVYDIWRSFGPYLERLYLSSGGDVFAAPSYRNFLQSIKPSPHLRIAILTNGLLLPRYWDSLSHLTKNISELYLSIDAATKKTYEMIRKGGKWEDLVQSMEMIKTLNVYDVAFNFVVMACNHHEIPQFVEMCRQYGARPQFAPMIINQWNKEQTLTKSHYEEILGYSVWDEKDVGGKEVMMQAYHDLKEKVGNWTTRD